MKGILFLLMLLCFASSAYAGDPILLVTNEWTPYVSTNEQKPGVITEIVVAAFKAVNQEVRIEYRPWRRCALMVEEGKAFGAFPYAATEGRSRYSFFSDQLWVCHNVFFYLKGRLGDFDFTSLDDLQQYVIAGTSGNYYEDVFRKKGLNVDYAPGEASGVRKLWEYRADLFAESEAVGWTLINRIFPSFKHMFAATPTPWNNESQTIMVSKRYPDAHILLERFNTGLRIIRNNGTYARIARSYLEETQIGQQE